MQIFVGIRRGKMDNVDDHQKQNKIKRNKTHSCRFADSEKKKL